VEGIAADLARKRRVLAALESAEQASLSPLPFLRDLTEALPPEAWISALNLNKRGVEITGQAAAASQLIPLLEGLPWLERVEFTSPVTKARDKEQFRIRAAWEADAARRAVDNGAARPAGPARPGPGAQPVPVPGGRGPRVPVRPAPGGGG
jgi:Tfp pilus assembly protein PilN